MEKVKLSQRQTGTLYAEVTNRIVAELEAGRVPWVQPWDGAKVDVGMPRNAGTGRRYSGINVLILWARLFERGFASQGWLTYRQAQALGGNVRKGEAGTTVCYADRFTPKSEDGQERGEGRRARSRSSSDSPSSMSISATIFRKKLRNFRHSLAGARSSRRPRR